LSFELNFEQLQQKLKKVLNPSRFRFVVILYPNTNMIDEIKKYIKEVYPESLVTSLDLKDKSYQDIASKLYKNNEGFVYLNDFEEILNNPDLYNGFNQRRDKIALHNINLICFISLYQKEELFTKAINVIPDLWEFKNTVLELEKDIKTDKLSDIKVSDSGSYSSIGGLTTKDKEIELKKLLERLKESNSDELKLNLLDQISTIYKDIGSFKESLHYRQQELEIIKGSESKYRDLANSYTNVSLMYHNIGDLKNALEYQEKALEVSENTQEMNFSDLATNYNNLASIYKSADNLSLALEYQQKALNISEKIQEKTSPVFVTINNNLATIHIHRKELQEALNYQKTALDIAEKIFQSTHPDLALQYNNISIIYQDMGELFKALEYQEKALKIRKKILGDKHPDLAQSYNNVSMIYQELKECNKAKEYLEKCLKILEQLNYTHPKYLIAKKNLKIINSEIKKQQKAGFKKRGKYCKDI